MMNPNASAIAPGPSALPDSLPGLLALNGNAFAQGSYALLLGRCATSREVEQVLARLLDGDAKPDILAAIIGGHETGGAPLALPGLRIALLHHRMGRIPVIGRLYCVVLGLESDAPAARRARALEQRMFVSMAAACARLGGVRERLDALGRAREERQAGLQQALERQRALLRAEHTIDRKVWAIEQAEAKKYSASILQWARDVETYAKSLEAEVARLRTVHESERAAWHAARGEFERTIAGFEREKRRWQDSGHCGGNDPRGTE